ncbi:MAG: class I SAM-dependent methyltransferase [Mariprofundales bacterium]
MKTPLQFEYAQLATNYDMRWSFYIQATTAETIKQLELLSGMQLLDVGCGTGALLQSLQNSAPNISMFGIDPSLEMLTAAREKLSANPNETYLSAGWAEAIPFPDQSFDVIVSCSSLHYWQQAEVAFDEIARVLRPEGKVIITDWCNNYLSSRINDLYLRAFNNAHYKTYNIKECNDILAATGFCNINIKQYKINWAWGMMTAHANKKPLLPL